jgi:hypothetical protein
MKPQRYIGKEDEFQITVAKYLDSLGVLYCHVTNEGMIPVHYRAKLKRKGLKNGVPDILIFEPNKEYSGLAIELKLGYNKPSPEINIGMANELKFRGWYAIWSNSLDEVINIIDNYLNNR